jgi:hypothetical protein
MNENRSPGAMPPDEELVAYLDGELDADNTRRIEELLACDVKVRDRLQQMERTWDLLDDLDAAPADGHFAQTTLEMVAVAAQRDVAASLADAPRQRRHRRRALGAGLLAAAAAGFLAVAWLWPDPNRPLLDDLPVLENFDAYRQIDNLEFARQLRPLFPGKEGVSAADTAAAQESIAQRRQRIEHMDPAEHEKLSRLQQRFATLNAAEQERLRRLDESLRAADDGPLLRRTIHRYWDWLNALPLYARGELAGLDPAERIKAIERRLKDATDLEALQKWMHDRATGREAQFLSTLPEPQRKGLMEMSPAARHQWVFLAMYQRRRPGGGVRPLGTMLTDEDLATLRGLLSPQTRQELESKPKEQQRQTIAGWMHDVVREERSHSHPAAADDPQLADFFDRVLTDEERDRLLAMPGEEMLRSLQQLYLTRTGQMRRPNGQAEGARGANRPDGPRSANQSPKNADKPAARRGTP